MATSPRYKNPTVEEQLFEEGCRFEFFQAVRLLEKLADEAKGVLNVPIEIRFFSTVSTAFPASDVQQVLLRGIVEVNIKGRRLFKLLNFKDIIAKTNGPRPLKLFDLKDRVEFLVEGQTGRLKLIELAIQVNFMGLAGAHGPLPPPYTELIIERVWKKDNALRDFLDIFNHQLVSLFYRARKVQRLGVETYIPWQSRFADHLFALMGLGTPGLRNRLPIKDHPLLFYAGLFVHQSRSLSALENLLADFFQIEVVSEPFIGQWQDLPDDEYTFLGINQQNQVLGRTTVLGTRIWDQQGKFGLHLGPLSLKQFKDFLPTGTGFKPLCEITRFFVGPELDFEINLILKKEEIPQTQLSHHDGGALGWTSWLKTEESHRDATVKLLVHNVGNG